MPAVILKYRELVSSMKQIRSRSRNVGYMSTTEFTKLLTEVNKLAHKALTFKPSKDDKNLNDTQRAKIAKITNILEEALQHMENDAAERLLACGSMSSRDISEIKTTENLINILENLDDPEAAFNVYNDRTDSCHFHNIDEMNEQTLAELDFVLGEEKT